MDSFFSAEAIGGHPRRETPSLAGTGNHPLIARNAQWRIPLALEKDELTTYRKLARREDPFGVLQARSSQFLHSERE